jgi:hypothetical protein
MRPWPASHRTNVLLIVGLLFVGGLAAGIIVQRLVSSSPNGAASTTTTRLKSSSTAATVRRSAAPAVTPAPPAEAVTELAPEADATFAGLQRELPGPVEVAVMPVGAGEPKLFGSDEPAHGWSTMKIPVIVALMTALEPHELSDEEQEETRLAITESSNEAILDLFHDLEGIKGGLPEASEAIEEELQRSGDRDTVVATQPPPPGAVTTFGQTEWAPSSAVLFFSALDAGCLLHTQHTQHILSLMEQIVPSESWGLGSANFAHVAFKGGWGPEGEAYLVRQSGIIDPGTAKATAVAIIAHPPPAGSSFDVGTEMITRTATWLHRVLHPVRHTLGCA